LTPRRPVNIVFNQFDMPAGARSLVSLSLRSWPPANPDGIGTNAISRNARTARKSAYGSTVHTDTGSFVTYAPTWHTRQFAVHQTAGVTGGRWLDTTALVCTQQTQWGDRSVKGRLATNLIGLGAALQALLPVKKHRPRATKTTRLKQ
jgi:hypothetical protein